MNNQQSLNTFIVRLAKRIAALYPSNYADREDYIQAGHLKLAEINGNKYKKQNSLAYAIIAISRAMRETALEAMCAISAPNRIKKQIYKIKILEIQGKTQNEICQELQITQQTLMDLRLLTDTKSWNRLFNEPVLESELFSAIDDLLSSDYLTEEDRIFIRAQFNGTIENLGMNKKQQWLKKKNLRYKLIRSGYGTTTD